MHGYPRPGLESTEWTSLNGPRPFALDPEPRLGEPLEMATARGNVASGRRGEHWWWAWLTEPRSLQLLLLGGLVLGAAVLRFRDIAVVPTWTDEVRESTIALDIALGRALPLVNVHAYIGALWNYLVAGAFGLFGLGPDVPRLVALVFGLCTIVATFLLGRQLAGPAVGLIGATLLGVSGADVLISSRIAYSHSLTPLFATLAVWLLLRAARGSGPSLALAGLSSGLALQTHVIALALVPAFASVALARRRTWPRCWPILGVVLGLAAYLNVLLFNLSDGLRGLRQGLDAADLYAEGRGSGLDLILANARDLLLLHARLLSGAVDVRAGALDYLLDPLVVLSVGLFLLGLARATLRVSRVPLLVLASFSVLLVLVNGKYELMPNARFLMPVVPLSLALIGLGITDCARRVITHGLGQAMLTACLAGVLILASLARLGARMSDFEASRANSAALSTAAEPLLALREPSEPVLLDQGLRRLSLDGGGHVHMALLYRLRLDQAPVASVELRRTAAQARVDQCADHRVVVQRLVRGTGDPLERLIPDAQARGLPAAVWVVRAAPLDEPTPGGVTTVVHRPPVDGFWLAAAACGAGRRI